MSLRRALLLSLAVAVLGLVVPAAAWADGPQNAPNPGPAAGGLASTPPQGQAENQPSNGNCPASALLLNLINPFSNCNIGSQTVNGVPQLPGDVAGAAGSAVQGSPAA
jgi:hypothetical protein